MSECIVVGEIETNCWIHPYKENYCMVVDPGGDAEKIVSSLNKLKLIPSHIILTHGHFDHLAAVPDLIKAFNHKIEICIHSLEANYLGMDSLKLHHESIIRAGGSPAFIDALWKGLPEADIILEEGSIIGPIKVLHLPGHSRGSIALYDEKAGLLFSGDTLFKANWGRTDLPGGSESKIYDSLKRLLSMDQKIKVCPGHGDSTTIKDEQGLIS